MYNNENAIVKPMYHFFRFSTYSRLKKMQENGHIYMKNLRFFRDLERKTMIRGKGDQYEARLFNSSKVEIFDPETNELIGKSNNATVQDESFLKSPVFCMTFKNLFEDVDNINDSKIVSHIKFNSKLFKDFEDLGEELFVLIITNTEEFLKRFKIATNGMNCKIQHGIITYRDTSYIYKNGDKFEFNSPFHKDTFFEHQEEFRILIDEKVDDNLEIEIGDISDISTLLNADQLKNGLRIEGSIGKVEKL